ncbi:MAG: NUDIX domain-containing protein [Candidatus Pacebacteria bacterium]|nr:NUDIX domain-containing protein [Candidatus Paceibacterota bacterium]
MDTVLRVIHKTTFPLVKIFWKLFRPNTKGVKVLLICNNEILLVKNIGKDYFLLPGGNMRLWGEDPVVCAKREVFEELGIKLVTEPELLGMYNSDLEGKKDTIYTYIFNLESKGFTKGWELDDARWFPLDSDDQKISPATKRRVSEKLAGKRGIQTVW